MWCVHISRCVPKSLHALMDISPNSWETVSWCTLGIPKLTKTMPQEQYERVWISSLPWETSIPVCNESKVSNSVSG